RSQTVGVHRSSDSPRVNLRQRKILVDKDDAISILLEQVGKQCLVHARAERTLEVIEIDDHDSGILVPAGGPPNDIDLLHDFSVRIFTQVELGQSNQSLAILGKQELVV